MKHMKDDILSPVTGIVVVLVCIPLCGYLMITWPAYNLYFYGFQAAAVCVGIYLLVLNQARIQSQLLIPLAHLGDWAVKMRRGNLSAQMPVPRKGKLADVARDINDLGESLRSLSREMDQKVREQTQRLQKKNTSLEILYDVAASSNTARDINELLVRYLETMANILDAHAGTVRLINDDDYMYLIGSTGIDNSIVEKERNVPIERCLCAQNYTNRVISCKNKRFLCGNLLYSSLPYGDKTYAIAIPLQYRNRTLGIYNLFVEDEKTINNPDIVNILTNIGQHISLAIEKARLDDESKRLTIMQERTMLAHELHDSLAQTLASLRFRVSLLSQTLHQGDHPNAIQEVFQLKNGLDEANTELRELLAHFRVRMDERGLIPATENLVERFKKESDIAVFFQTDCSQVKLPPLVEVQVLHIIQESLTNIRKHSKAENVRILIRCDEEDRYHVLIEDDGIGIESTTMQGQPGEHVGLSIMQERARRIGGELIIESEPGEGTRVEFDINCASPQLQTDFEQFHYTQPSPVTTVTGKSVTGKITTR
jgi:two-component system nitrate/nitrite sensor histidine kinase NarX